MNLSGFRECKGVAFMIVLEIITNDNLCILYYIHL